MLHKMPWKLKALRNALSSHSHSLTECDHLFTSQTVLCIFANFASCVPECRCPCCLGRDARYKERKMPGLQGCRNGRQPFSIHPSLLLDLICPQIIAVYHCMPSKELIHHSSSILGLVCYATAETTTSGVLSHLLAKSTSSEYTVSKEGHRCI